ncbi:vasotocin-neurophysin VT-like [Centruroides sculpturatus]|uniref:vasotocin-neurophysin VT-like n=1 Tax=Centruroides sculpturatus TaxID=218467 RepID=UPI000C6CD2C2|nr:vasotocin-neurophysin VT-like [Centruroides sculpturatus]
MHSPLFFSMLIVLTSACFITNCPPGGKRSLHTINCPSCEFDEKSKCSIRGLCCGSTVGCIINEEGIPICQQSFDYHHCRKNGRICRLHGICTTNGICCVKDLCFEDSLCTERTEDIFIKNKNIWKKLFPKLKN